MVHLVLVGAPPELLINFRGDLIDTLVRSGHRVTAVSAPANHEVAAQIKALGAEFRQVPLVRSGLNPWADIQTLLALRRLFRDLRPDAVLAYTIKPVIWGGMALVLMRTVRFHALITGLGFAFQGNSWQRRLLTKFASLLYRLALMRSDTVIFQNPDDRQVFLSRNIIKPAKCHVVNGSGVNLDRFAVSASSPVSPKFLMIARLLKEKGLFEFVEAARITRRQYPEAEFRILGPLDPSPDGISPSQVEKWQQEGVIQYLGATSDVRPFLADCSVYVLPSYYGEGIPRTVLEAMAVGRPILTTNVPGCRETVEPAVNGFLVPARDANALAERIVWFMCNKDKWQRMGNASRRLAVVRFDTDKVNSEMLRIIGLSGETKR